MRAYVIRIAKKLFGKGPLEEPEVLYKMWTGPPGVLVEAGAHHGDDTFFKFAAAGWEIHAFEPDPANFRDLQIATAAMPRVKAIQKAVSDKSGTLTLYTSDESTGISSLTPFTKSHKAAAEVDVTTLSDYLISEAVDRVDVLKMDIEGFEKLALEAYPWHSHRPRAILVEFEDLKTGPLGYTWQDLSDYLVNHGYIVLVSEWYPIVRYGSIHRWRRFRRYPSALSDKRAWGNLLAVEKRDYPALRRHAFIAAGQYRARRTLRWAAGPFAPYLLGQ